MRSSNHLQLIVAPDVILIAERDDVAGAEADRLFEILNAAEILFVEMELMGIDDSAANSLSRVCVSSVERSSQMTISSGGRDCATILSNCAGRNAAPL